MPRIYTSASNPLDFCKKHFPREEFAERVFGNAGDGPDGRGNCFSYNDDHPPYENEDYICVVCGKPLAEEDN